MNNVVCVSGITGFVGGNVAKELLTRGYEVIGLVREINEESRSKIPLNIPIIESNFKNRCNAINLPKSASLIHCAWDKASEHNSMDHIEDQFLDHYFYIKNLISHGFKKIIITGSCIEYGKQYGPVSSNSSTEPNTAYALSKDFLHKSLRLLQKDINFELIWARLFYIYGEGQFFKNIIPQFDAALERGDKEFNMSLGEQLFDYLHVEDAAIQIADLLKHSKGVFNICSGKPISLRRLLENRMKHKNKKIHLNLGYYEYRENESLALWGKDFSDSES